MNKKFTDFEKECHKDRRGDLLTLPDLLIQPIQRPPRYKLLLEQLKKLTSEDHPDFKDITIACEKLDSMCFKINEQKKKVENMSEVLRIQKQFTGNFQNLVMPDRQFLKQGVFKVFGAVNRKILNKEYVLFLFSDILVFTESESQNKFHFVDLLLLNECEEGENLEKSFSLKHKPEFINFTSTSSKTSSEWATLLAQKMISCKPTKIQKRS